MEVTAPPLLIECDACLEPAPLGKCARCGAEVVERSGGSSLVEGPYRASPKNDRIELLPFELARAPASADFDRLLGEWREAKRELVSPHDDEVELRATWLAAVLGAAYAERRDRIRERALLETAWSRIARPLYRDMIAARLARKAAREGDLERASAWLAQIEVPSPDAEVARAVLAHARGEDEFAMEIIGAAPSARVIQGSARLLACVVRVSVLDEREDALGAHRAHEAACREHGAAQIARVAKRLALARPKDALRTKHIALAGFAIAGVLVAIAWMVAATY